MYSQQFYLKRVRLAEQLGALPENAGRRRAYITMADNWRKLAKMAAIERKVAAAQSRRETASTVWEPMLDRAMREAGLT
jgi:hypothetical protein